VKVSKLLTKIKSGKDTSIKKGSGLHAKNKQDAPDGVFKSFFKKLQEDNSDSKKSDTKNGSVLKSGKESSSGKLPGKDTVLGGNFSLANSKSGPGTKDIKKEKITVNKEEQVPDKIIEKDKSESKKSEASQKVDAKKTDKKGNKTDVSEKKDQQKADPKKTAEPSVQITGKEISKVKDLSKKQPGNEDESTTADQKSGETKKIVTVRGDIEKGKTVAVVDKNSMEQPLANGKKEVKDSGKSTATHKGKSSGIDNIRANGTGAKAGDLRSNNKSVNKVIVESSKSGSGESVSVNADQKKSKVDKSSKNDLKAVVDDKLKGTEKKIPDQKPVKTEVGSIKKDHASRQSDTSAKSKQVSVSTYAEIKKNRDGQGAINKQSDISDRNLAAHNKMQKKPEEVQLKKTDEHSIAKNLKTATVDEKIAADGTKKTNTPANSDKRLKILTKVPVSAPVVKEQTNATGENDRQITRQQKIAANNFSSLKNGKEAGLADAMEKVTEQVTSKNGKGKKSEPHRNNSRGRLPLSNRSMKSSMSKKMFAGFSDNGNSDYSSKEQKFKLEQHDTISPEGTDKEKMSKGMDSSGFKLNQMPVANAFLRQRIIPGLTKSIKNAARSTRNGNNTGKWEKHNFVLEDGKNINLSVRENKGILQVKMGSLNVDLRKLLQQNMHQIKQHMKQEFGTNIDLQFSNNGEQQQSSGPFKGSSQHRNSGNQSNQFSDGKVATQTTGRGSVNSVRNFGYNQMEWQA